MLTNCSNQAELLTLPKRFSQKSCCFFDKRKMEWRLFTSGLPRSGIRVTDVLHTIYTDPKKLGLYIVCSSQATKDGWQFVEIWFVII